VSASPELQELVELQRRAVAATQVLEDDPVPATLAGAVERTRRPRPRRLVARLATVGALAAVVAMVAAVVLTGGPGSPTVADAAQFAATAPATTAPRATGDGTSLAVDVERVVFPDLLRAYGWRAVGVHRGEIDGRDATVVVYERDGRRIAYGVVAGDGLPRPTDAQGTSTAGVLYQTARIDGRLVVTWRRLGHTCVLVGDAPPAELLAIASYRV
jgi:hypothetical protein